MSQIETKAKDFFEDSGMMHTNGTRMDLQAKGEIVNQEMIWVINKPTGMGIYDPSYEPERNNNSSSELSEPKLESIKAGTFQFLKDYDSDQRREEESFPYYRFRSPMTFFSRYDFSLSSDAIYVDPKKYLDWQEVTSSDSGEIVYSSSAKASAFVVKSSDPITYSENFICDTQVYYESDREDLPLEPGEQLARNDIKVSESLTIVNSTKAKLKYDYTISSDQDFHLGPWQEPAMGDHEEGEFDLDCSEANSVLDHSLFTAD